ncbi:SH3 domain-containing protein [Alkaliphilus sp. MSJ-5]|uniref:SH3 domain-containing protein n=1 Tax=Alkaliphilus flagellatus TaxID=2841507 RepID=A0ABS6G5P3_9FIRM|nr:SH3 domain-containing protein [Alkaliphilus flagellatus]MBU5677688.1 SH3 domain-containing protein [Alkaliphilus flagellatus]
MKNKNKYIMCMALASALLSTTVVSGLDYKATIIAPEAIVRQEKVFDSKELDKLNIGTQITVKEVLDNWYRVELSDGKSEGWISSEEATINDKSYTASSLKKGEVTASVLNVRIGPSTNNSIINKIYNGNIVTIINTSNGWYEVVLDNNMKGWVHSDYIKLTYNLPSGKINTNAVVLKEQANNISADVISLKKEEVVYIKGYSDNWYNVITSSAKEGWIESKYVTVLLTEKTNVNRSGSSREVFDNIESITEKYLGKKYVYGAGGPDSFDCSGFSSYILKTYYSEYLNAKGITQLPRTASGQATIGTTVSRADLQKGDLVFLDTSGKIGDNITHVGIYIGNGQIIHASTSKRQIVKDSLSDRYYSSRFMKAVRL